MKIFFIFEKKFTMEITGTLKVKGDEQVVSDKFRKREFVITDSSSQYPQYISFQLTQDRCVLLDNYNVDDVLTVHFNVRGREWKNPQGETKYFNSLEAWRFERKTAEGAPSVPHAGAPSEMNAPIPSTNDMPVDAKDDLPF